MNGAEEGAIKRSQDFQRNSGPQDFGPRALLHFVRGAVGKCHDRELREPIPRICAPGDLHDPVGDCSGFSRTGGGSNGEVFVQLLYKPFATRLIDRLVHERLSSSAAKGGWVCTHFSSRNSLSIGSV